MKKFFAMWKCRDIYGMECTAVIECQRPDWKLYLDNLKSRRAK
jgi:hypothetical protein